MHTTARRVWPLATWIVLVLLISLLPLPFKNFLKTHGRFHNGAHFFAFLITVLLVCWGRSNAWIVASCAGAICLAFLIEGAQTAFYHNDFEWGDILVDSLGAVAGGMIYYAYREAPDKSLSR
jgi:VanZ family protein